MPEDRRRIAILLPNLGGGGAERVALGIARDLAERGHEVDLLLVQATGQLLPLVPKAVRVVDLGAHRLIAALPALTRYLKDRRPDALNVHMWPLTVIGIMAHRLAGSTSRLVVTDHVAFSRNYLSARQLRLLRWTTRLFYPLADRRTLVSNAAADVLAKLSGIPRNRFDVLYNPISPPDRFTTNARVEALWPGKGPRIISVGSLNKVKNHALLLDAFARLATPDAQLMILGEGPLRDELEERAVALGIADRVILPGFALDPWPYLAAAQLFVLSSDYEGFPLVLAEAMHAGLQIVSTDCVSGPAEMLDGGDYGRLVPCNDATALAAAIDAALAEPADALRMKARAEAIAGPEKAARWSALLTA